MILSYHPCFEADTNLLCAGRQPDEKDRDAIGRAEAVILPQGCPEALHKMARRHCAHVFPHYDARFGYPGKTGQARLFESLAVPRPRTWVFTDAKHFQRHGRNVVEAGFPLVLKLDWGGEGDTVFPLFASADLDRALSRAAAHERSGQRGFVVQRFIAHSQRTLRVVVIGEMYRAYWRIQEDPSRFGTSVTHGARIDHDADPYLQEAGKAMVRDFCRRSRINLAGFDVIYDDRADPAGGRRPMMLEINYFFGRRGLGGSEPFYGMLQDQIENWLSGVRNQIRRPDTKPDGKKRP